MSTDVSFSDISTIGIGGRISRFVEPNSRVGVIEAVEEADSRGLPLMVIGGGSNTLAQDEPFEGIVVRDARSVIAVPDEVAPVEGVDRSVHLQADAGANWDDMVAMSVDIGLQGIEALSGIPGSAGASVVQNIGAYGQQVGDVVDSVEVWDRLTKTVHYFRQNDLHFGYRTSLLKESCSETFPDGRTCGSTPRYVVLSIVLKLRHAQSGSVGYTQLAQKLGVQVGEMASTAAIRQAVLGIRAQKGMLEDPRRYLNPIMTTTRRPANIEEALYAIAGESEEHLLDRHSCGSFFVNPHVSRETADRLPPEAPRYEALSTSKAQEGVCASNKASELVVKTSAAWLIEHAGFTKGYALPDSPQAALSSRHTLAITNRGNATCSDIMKLARTIEEGVRETFGVALQMEPVRINQAR